MSQPISPNSLIGDYTIISKVGEGGMGEVWRACDTKLGRDVAIKVLPAAFSSDVGRLRRFEQEAQAAGALNHPNILVIYHIGNHDGSPYIASEFLEGETLRDLLDGHPLPQRKALDYALQLAVGLAAAHEKGIVHRDIKPENIFITNDGRLKILDFGLAKLSPSYEELAAQTDIPTRKVNTDPGTVMGTLGCMSPEQLKGKIADHRSDIFSFGAILYEMLSGKRAFRRDSTAETMSAILREEPPDLSETNRTVSPALERIVRRCLEKNPAQRFHSTSDLAFAIEALSSPSLHPGESVEPVAVSTTSHVASSRPGWLGYSVAAVALIGLMAMSFSAFRYLSPKTPIASIVRFPILLPEKTTYVTDVEDHNLSISPDGRQLAFIGESEGQRRIYVRSLDQVTARALQGTDRAYSPFWSPDSHSIAFFADGKLKRIEASGGPVQTICEMTPRDTTGTWGADGTILFPNYDFVQGQGVLYQVNSAGGKPTPFLNQGDIDPLWVSFLPDSRNFLFYGRRKNRERDGIYAGTVGSNDTKQIATVPRTRVEYAAPGYLIFVREGSIVAQPFDAKGLSVSGEPKLLVEQIPYFDPTGFSEFSVSDTGVLVYQADNSLAKLAWFDRGGHELGRIGSPDRFQSARLSPDGKQMAVAVSGAQSSSADIWIYDLNGGRNRFVSEPTDDSNPIWSPDGRRIAYFGSTGKSTLRIKDVSDASGTGESPIPEGFIGPTDWSRDGRYLIYDLNDPTVQRDLWILPLGGTQKPFPFLQTKASEWDAKFSPNGRFVVFNSDESGTDEVYVSRFDKPSEKIRVSSAGGIQPHWRPDGRELFYISAAGEMMAVAFAGDAEAPKLGTPTALFPATELKDYDVVAPDGQRFLVVTGTESQSAPIHVMLNWETLLRVK